MRRYLPELVALPLLPFLVAQGKYTRRVTPRLPEAGGPLEGVCGAIHKGTPLTLLTIGESPVAGVGVDNHNEAITGQLAQSMADALHRPVTWRACGRNGVTVREALDTFITTIPHAPVDVVLVAFGVNDTTAFRAVSQWRRDLQDVLDEIERRCQPGLVLLSGVPPLRHFPALPQPLRWVMGLKADVLDAAARELADAREGVRYVPLALDTDDRSMMASDGYHPSAKGCTAWAATLAEAVMKSHGRDVTAR
ncbi:SGNH/GDSL hydrolase family protein [Noviherbaspirillum denitrificans]|uniref:Lysophospholipase n=1 Tax=Noviherbaspirillum denitrificans TaxID=1968433 RepID=A0A254T6K0_9BURK|nr:SGNH/GDSL hydrolase family protein [Noviherbaspirillum denitrificans]OWW18225.1 lysophospholipase [Noviherbaspirillum denitrificans]